MARSDGKVVVNTALNNSGLEKGIKSISGTLGGLGKTVGKACLAITAAFATATVAVTKQAVDAYADYEQLTGGMETLFKTSASKIAGYAEDAFYTAGVSANKYMEIVTSFSASLISSLSGDTEKAADVANMALIDMSDNANKMGTDMGLIQNAYQGFAKQNYTMLDNLKLGYGGTKTEMERLLKDAEAFSGMKYDISNLSDVYNAIHAIQEKLGIAGATAEEAEKTIIGSANMTKAAWENVLVAISGGGDLDKAINNLVFAVSKYFENIVPVVERSLSGIGQLIEKIAPQLVQSVATALIKAIPSLLNAVYKMIIGLFNGIYQGIVALFSGNSVTSEVSAQINGVADSAAGAAAAEKDLAEGIEEAGKAAKKSLAGFDELNTLQDNSSSTNSSVVNTDTSTGSTASVSAITEATSAAETAMQPLITKIQELIAPLQNIDLSPAIKSFKKLGGSIKKLGKTIGSSLEWFWFNILVPLAGFVIEDALPRFFDLLATAVDTLNTVLNNAMDILKQFVDDFLKPVAEHTAEKFLTFLDNMSDKITELDTILQESTAWEDLKIILDKVYDVLEPILTCIIDLVFWLGNLVLDTAWTEAKDTFNDLEDSIGLIASLIQGDFDDAWEHLKDLMWENDIDKAKENADNLKGSMETLKTTVLDFEKKWKETITNIVDEWAEKISAWWTENVEPWFTIEKWEEVIQGMVDGFANSWNKVYDFFAEEIPQWWDDNIAPWFTKKKWEELWEDVVTGIRNGWDSFTSFFTETIPKWWNDNIAPWFTKEKWKELGEEAIKGLANAIIDGINGLITELNKFSIEVPKMKGLTDGFTLGFNIPTIPKLAQGAVLPANKPFLAMVGEQKHGTNIEAPLSTIQEAVALVMQDQTAAILSGFEASVGVQREILEAVLGIQIGDDVIGNAVSRYSRKQAIIRGGAL